MTKQGTILIVDDNKGVLAAIDMLLSGTFKKVITISNPNRIPAMLETENIDVVLLDMNFSGVVLLLSEIGVSGRQTKGSLSVWHYPRV